ncbi:MAG: 4-alpha-glucanotransferase [Planctomycetales bacterium]|nr:4-alpha-glucanotransferase [Planctomycetales bacterium]
MLSECFETTALADSILPYRASGVLLHPTSLPGRHGIGDLGQAAFEFVDWLRQAHQSLWQVLPLGPTGYGDSPYSSLSSFAGNPLLISLDRLVEAGDLSSEDSQTAQLESHDRVAFGEVIARKSPLLVKAARHFLGTASHERRADFESFCDSNASWLDDYALYMAVKEHYDAHPDPSRGWGWNARWDKDIASRDPVAVAQWHSQAGEAIAVQKVLQFYFFSQWSELKRYANSQGIEIIGDVPIFVALDSADVWSAPDMFQLDDNLQPTHVAGVPPDYFSATGQRWGNPLYDWDRMKLDGFSWWLSRFERTRALVDYVRVDHFRGFAANWSIPADQPTAIHGQWTPAPGRELFSAMRDKFGELPILAEDLGLITEDVEALRDEYGFPGMRVLQFGFGELGAGANTFLPYAHVPNCVVYTGTHDNDTVRGWYESLGEQERGNVATYLGFEPENISWTMIRLALSSVGKFAILPMQDLLDLGSEGRMNRPSIEMGNWSWRMSGEYQQHGIDGRLAELVRIYGRDERRWQNG